MIEGDIVHGNRDGRRHVRVFDTVRAQPVACEIGVHRQVERGIRCGQVRGRSKPEFLRVLRRPDQVSEAARRIHMRIAAMTGTLAEVGARHLLMRLDRLMLTWTIMLAESVLKQIGRLLSRGLGGTRRRTHGLLVAALRTPGVVVTLPDRILELVRRLLGRGLDQSCWRMVGRCAGALPTGLVSVAVGRGISVDVLLMIGLVAAAGLYGLIVIGAGVG